jgi:signal transduction histidine kinase
MPNEGTRADEQSAAQEEDSARAPAPMSGSGLTVAVIDDDVALRDALKRLLERAGFRVLSFGNALAALLELQASRPDLILLDLMMPGMDGWQFRLEQRARAHLADVPVIAMSADPSSHAAAVDAAAFVQKPFDFDHLLGVAQHVLLESSQRRLLARAVERERSQTLEMLVEGVAHAVNNPLAYVMGELELLSRRLDKIVDQPTLDDATVSALRASLGHSLEGVQRIAHIIRLFSTFSRPSSEPLTATDVHTTVDAATRLAVNHIRHRAVLQCRLDPIPKVQAQEGPLAHVLLHLLVNAAHAIPNGERSKHRISIATYVADDHVVIEVSDSGHGMSDEVKKRIFEPFYTTKPAGTGTGLGLSFARQVVESFGGRLSVESSPGQGSKFRAHLRIAEPTVDVTAPAPMQAAKIEPRVLVIDDEPMIGSVLSSVLDKFRVDCVTDPKQALLRLEDRDIDVVMCDLSMPMMSGIELYRELCKRRPDLADRFVLMTGAAADERVEELARTAPITLLPKPFRVVEVEAAIHAVSLRPRKTTG